MSYSSMPQHSLLGLGPGGFHRIAYTEWGDPANPRVLVCVHGLTRNGRDFDRIAAAMADRCRVVCPDIAGRGRSDWLPAAEHYSYPQYCADMTALIARTGAESVDWLGTSMGGLIGIMMAAQKNTPVERLVVNDVGPFIPKAATARIARYVGENPTFDDFAAALTYIRRVAAAFGPLSDSEWRHLTEHSVKPRDGKLVLRRDPKIAVAFTSKPPEDVDLWPVWDAVRCPTLVLRGVESDLLLPETAEAMTRSGPKAQIIEFRGIGHAPALMAPDHIAAVREFLLAGR
jgi:pimeloyl-ACP methyl ester carboxylesterase